MNFLAHLFLSGDNEKIMVGNFIGDFVKGSQIEQYVAPIQKGIRLHRAIDAFTDQHLVVLESKKRLRSEFGHYSPVIVDVFYDHFVARDWAEYSSESLLEFTNRFYNVMEKYDQIVPRAVNGMLHHMRIDNWLYNYQYLEGIDQALTGMSKRTKFQSNMEFATASLREHYTEFESEFRTFFPDLQAFANNFEK